MLQETVTCSEINNPRQRTYVFQLCDKQTHFGVQKEAWDGWVVQECEDHISDNFTHFSKVAGVNVFTRICGKNASVIWLERGTKRLCSSVHTVHAHLKLQESSQRREAKESNQETVHLSYWIKWWRPDLYFLFYNPVEGKDYCHKGTVHSERMFHSLSTQLRCRWSC